MTVRSPSMSALRALEAAARHLSYTRAAEELFVTQSAISHQIKHMEELWGIRLFERRGRRLILTEAGHALVLRLGHFNHQYPEIDVWISTSDELVDFDAETADVGIRLGYGHWTNLYEELLLSEYVFPVCSPHFLNTYGAPEKPADLLDLPLLPFFWAAHESQFGRPGCGERW